MDLDSHIERILWTEDEISHRVHELATQISIDFSETPDNPDSSSSSAASVPAVVGVATGAFLFLADLVRKIKLPITVDFIRVESYGSGTVSSGKPKISCDLKIDVRDRHVILVEDIVDTGNTVSILIDHLASKGASSVSLCTLLNKPSRRKVNFELLGDGKFYCGFEVKQQKKSSNKWICVVCNQKQSVRKVYAQGYMAKDVRKFVQSINMSRQLAEQNPQFEEQETLETEDQSSSINRKQKRTDWSEYVDPAEEDDFKSCEIDEIFGDEIGLKIVTEMPKAVFKKPKLNKYSSSSNSNTDGNGDLPAFSKSSTKVKLKTTTQGQDDKFEKKMPLRNQSATSSKWNCYITEDTHPSIAIGGGGDLKLQDDPFEHDNDQRVEEHIHPDFL
ncbi:hypothetical protein M9H77_31818 [Catharanthus roseus]|uniref:Uncharacterized protein n=1 Tax=Catharanthus roseus TaxID=4058 RepID=A0ACC0A515_CATRO|nr:hypothetical protein M9H77_31818 [Catharanthus roseus]